MVEATPKRNGTSHSRYNRNDSCIAPFGLNLNQIGTQSESDDDDEDNEPVYTVGKKQMSEIIRHSTNSQDLDSLQKSYQNFLK